MDIIPTLAVIFLVLIIPLAGALAAFEEWLASRE